MTMPLDNFQANLDKVSFATLVNYLKIDPSSGSDTCPTTGMTKTITHSLGYIPHFEVYQEVPGATDIVNAQMAVGHNMGATPTFPYVNAQDFLGLPGGYVYATTSQLVIHFPSGASAAFKFWWRIYLQYGSQT